jgi:simple sugar transport system permease protein
MVKLKPGGIPGLRDLHLRLLGIITVVIFLGLSILRPDVFLSLNNLRAMSFQLPEFALLALAVSVTMLTGGIDLSIVGTAVLSAAVGVLLLESGWAGDSSAAAVAAIVIALVAGAGCGCLNGTLITRLRISPILATLGTMQLFTGLTVVLTGGTSLFGFSEYYLFLGNGSISVIPVPLVTLLAAIGLMAFLLNRTTFGFKLYLLGNNPLAARFAGIDNSRILLKTYILSGVLSALSGLTMTARTNSVNADYGTSYLLFAILVAVLAGIDPAGGFGKVTGLILAVFSLQFLSSGLNMLRFSSFSRELVWGALLLIVMATNQVLKRRVRTLKISPAKPDAYSSGQRNANSV